MSFVQSDCGTYYGGSDGEAEKGGEGTPAESFAGSNVDNRPGSNCDPLTIDGFEANPVQTVTYDATAPALNMDTPDEAAAPATVTGAAYTVGFDATDNLATLGGSFTWTLQRQIAPWDGSTCGTFIADAGAGAVVTGTTSANDQTSAQTLASGSCYRWLLDATDQNGDSPAAITSGTVRRDATALLGAEPYQRFESFDLGAGDDLAVNVATGNVLVTHPVVSLPIRGGSFDLALTYNSQDTSNVGMGPGWRLNVLRRLAVDPATGDVTFTDGDGSRHVFDWTGSAYDRPATIYATLTRTTGTPNVYTLTYRDQSVDVFHELVSNVASLKVAMDRFGNAVFFEYPNGILATATDPAGRTVAFTWDTAPVIDRLTAITDWANVSGGVVQTSGSGNRTHRFFYDTTTGRLAGWADPLDPSGSCPTAASHRTCLSYAAGGAALLTGLSRLQTYETVAGSALGTSTRVVTTAIGYRGGDIATVTDAGGAQTTFSRPADGQMLVVQPGTPASQTKYGLVTPADSLARVQSVWRKLGSSTWIEQRIEWADDASIEANERYPTEVWKVTDNYGGSPARTLETRYAASSMGLVAKVIEPLDGNPAHDRWTEYAYNANRDVTSTTVREANATSEALRTVTIQCWAAVGTTPPADQRTCPPGSGPALVRTIERYVAGGAVNVDTNVATDLAHDPYGQRTRETRHNRDAAGGALPDLVTGWTYDTSGNQTAEIRNYVSGTVTSPGDDVSPSTSTNARTDLTTAFGYDTAGNQISSADPRLAIDAAQGLSLAVDDYVARTVLDAHNQPVTTRLPATPTRIVAECSPSPGCREATTSYDETGLVRESRDVAGKVSGTTFDAAGRATETYQDDDGAGAAVPRLTGRSAYDAAGRLLWTEDAVQANDPAGGTDPGRTQFTYDELGRTLTTITAAGSASPAVASTTATAYDALDRRTSETVGTESPDAQTTTWRYDLGGRVTDQDDEFTCTTTAHDYRDRATSTIEGRAPGNPCTGTGTRTITGTHDGLGRLTARTVTGGDTLEATTFDAAGRALRTWATEGSTPICQAEMRHG